MDHFIEVTNELSKGGDWLGAARSWMQSNVKRGDSLSWSSGETVAIPFYKLEELARTAAVAAVIADRARRNPSAGQ